MGFHRMAFISEESEWLSQCCTAPPLYDLHETGEHELLGVCMSCREHTTFTAEEEENE